MPARRILIAAAAGTVAALAAAPQLPATTPSVRPLEPGFIVSPYVETGAIPTSLAFGMDTRADQETQRLYVTDFLEGTVLVVDDLAGVGSQPTIFAEGFRSPLGVVAASDGSVYVADAEAARQGPFGLRVYGRVWRVIDSDGDGTGDKKYVVLKDLPNGRHNTNGLAFGPDGMLYVANGNSTDDGVEGGEAEVEPWSGSIVRVDPAARKVSLADIAPQRALVAHGWRNVYDLAFSPFDPSKLFVPMNGVDDARQGSTGENPADPNLEDSDDLLYVTDINDRRTDDFGFPECLFNLPERGDLRPYNNPNPDVIDRFGRCATRSVSRPVASFGLHPSANGLAFQTTDAWAEDHVNDLFVTEWGSLFGSPAGHKVVRVQLDEAGTKVTSMTDFLEMDFPIDVVFDDAGAMYVADFSGAIFKVDRVP